jgi:phage gpG-like protein
MSNDIAGYDELIRKLEALGEASGTLTRQGLLAAGFVYEGYVKASMTEAKTGRTYRRGKKGTHTASAPGEAPAIDYGNLINSIGVKARNDNEVIVFTDFEAADYLEFGTPKGKMKARPFMRPPADERKNEIAAAANNFIAWRVKEIAK